MKILRTAIAIMVMGILTGVAYVGQANEPSGAKMADAADKFLAALTAEQKAKAAYSFDDEERFNWHFVPLQDNQKHSTRKGLPLEEMTPPQKDAVKELLQAGTSSDGYTTMTTIMRLETILRELEVGGAMVRNPGWYFLTVFGTPSKTGKWGWRIEGHHLSLNFTLDNGSVLSATPAFFGANPADVMAGPRKGKKTLADADLLAKDLYEALDDEQKKIAHQGEQFPEIAGKTRAPKVGEPKGIPAAQLTEKQRDLLLKVLKAYTNRMPRDVAEAEMSQVDRDGFDKVHFAYAGGLKTGQPHSYRIQGPTFVVEFLNVQEDSAKNPANHIHSAWRNLKGDFGVTP